MKLFYRRYGHGPPLIILHGLYGSSDNWVSIAKSISDRFTVYLPDLRNHGNSPHNNLHDYDSMSNDIIELSEALNINQYFLSGHSMGGKVAVAVAMKKPDLINGLIIADISPFTGREDAASALRQHTEILETIGTADLSAAKKREDVEMQLSAGIESKEIRQLIMKNLQRNTDKSFRWKINTESLLKNITNITDSFLFDSDNYQQITGFPVVFLKGENSGYISEEGFRDILRLFPGAELKVIQNAGHWLHSDNPEAVRQAFLDLLTY
jgi:esterase